MLFRSYALRRSCSATCVCLRSSEARQGAFNSAQSYHCASSVLSLVCMHAHVSVRCLKDKTGGNLYFRCCQQMQLKPTSDAPGVRFAARDLEPFPARHMKMSWEFDEVALNRTRNDGVCGCFFLAGKETRASVAATLAALQCFWANMLIKARLKGKCLPMSPMLI